ncbi:hypothetical protein SAMN04488003_11021 [Loktanella fryxellensis]|uniref:Hemolysin-type calcium-binding repeat-containing protein n=1 Tax=Loktanella fryxellensis TaxID=245187 RepID=A0A1H8E7F5_9RHOB|nr:hypothetical protein SAMN04488003_11021 [Loktanella fryxellensis]
MELIVLPLLLGGLLAFAFAGGSDDDNDDDETVPDRPNQPDGPDGGLLTDGDDRYEGTAGIDIVQAGNGDNRLMGQDGNDVLSGNGGDDTIDGDAGDDVLDGGSGNDTLHGNNPRDAISDGNDSLLCGQGNDTLTDTGGNNRLDGGTGNDTLWATTERTTMTGGVQADTFNVSGDVNIITDFEPGRDTLDIQLSFDPAAQNGGPAPTTDDIDVTLEDDTLDDGTPVTYVRLSLADTAASGTQISNLDQVIELRGITSNQLADDFDVSLFTDDALTVAIDAALIR